MHFKQDENIIIGNVALYGATSGKAYINGVAGERFCVRNSGAIAVVEGVGDHGCEYMTGGRVAVLGKTGKNFAAGMSGGIAYVLDEDRDLYTRLNKDMVMITELTDKYDVQELKEMIENHVAYTNSVKGKEILSNFAEYLPKFKRSFPMTITDADGDYSDGREGLKQRAGPDRSLLRQQESVRRGDDMGKPTGFMEYDRVDKKAQSPKERIKHFNESIPLFPKRSSSARERAAWTAACRSVRQAS